MPITMKDKARYGQMISNARKTLKLSHGQVSSKMGLPPDIINKIENGENVRWTEQKYAILEGILKIPPGSIEFPVPKGRNSISYL